MLTDTEIKQNSINILIENLGLVEAERFIALIQREHFDYTKWRKKLWKDKTVKEISNNAMQYRNKNS